MNSPMESKSNANACLLLSLTDELLIEICSFVLLDSTGRRDLDSLKALSQTNKYMRQFLVPDIFKTIVIRRTESPQDLLRALEDFEASPVQGHVKKIFR